MLPSSRCWSRLILRTLRSRSRSRSLPQRPSSSPQLRLPSPTIAFNMYLPHSRSFAVHIPRSPLEMMAYYNAAMARLAELPSNRAATSLFEPPTTTSSSSTASSGASTPQWEMKSNSDSYSNRASTSPLTAISTSIGPNSPPGSPGPPPAAPVPPSDRRSLNEQAIPEMLEWLGRAGYTQRDLTRMRHIHVAGTKGKGSVCAFATSMLRKYCNVGTYTSPHLVSPRERITVNGAPIPREEFADAVFELWDRFTVAALNEGKGALEAASAATKPFFFRFMTILAWHIFLKKGIRDVVMEVGIGGEFDATNVLPCKAVSATVVTRLGVDHVAMLGDTPEAIAWHKAGIFKPGVRAFVLRTEEDPSVMDVLRERAVEKGAELVELPLARVKTWGGVRGKLKGAFQKYNQALAIAAVREHLNMQTERRGQLRILEDLPDNMLRALREANLRGRCETLEDRDHRITWLLDGAHTADSLAEVAKWVAPLLEPEEQLILVFNQQQRNAEELLAGLVDAMAGAAGRPDVFAHGIFTRNEMGRVEEGADPRDVQVQLSAACRMIMEVESAGAEVRVSIVDNIRDAVATARRASETSSSGPKQKILVTGSFHLVGGVLRILEPDEMPI